MSLVSLRLRPGIYRNGTRYQAKGRWYDAQLVRFLEGSVRPVGGWEELKATGGLGLTINGVPRKLLAWRNNAGNAAQLGIGTNTKLYRFTQGALTDITPVGLTTGGADSVFAIGPYGSGLYGVFNYGEGDPAQGSLVEAASWQLDTWGEDLVGVLTSDGRVAYYDLSAGGVAQFISATWPVSGGTGSIPTGARALVVTPERFLFVLGADSNPRLVRWPHQETVNQFAVSSASTAGDFEVPGSGTLMCGIRGKNETLLFTDRDLFAAQYIGGTLVYSFKQVGSECGIISRHAAVVVGGQAVWMGQRGWYKYDGYVEPIPSDVSDYVFSDFNRSQRAKVWAMPLTYFGEIWWFYPSGAANDPDRYVIWNYVENHWSIGKLARMAGVDRSAFEYPMMSSLSLIFDHERGTARVGEATPYLESGPVEIAEGDQVLMARQIVPDEATLAGQVLGSVRAYLFSSIYPTATETQNGPFTLANPTSVRITARQVRLKLEEIVGGEWRVGTVRLEGVPGGLR